LLSSDVYMATEMKAIKQPELNIGTAGHVDHGKCISKDSQVLTPNRGVIDIKDIWNEAIKEGRIVKLSEYESIYDLNDLSVHSLNIKNFTFRVSKPLLYVQKYRGEIYYIVTRDGRYIGLTPMHPLPLYKNNKLVWSRVSNIGKGDTLIVPRDLNNINSGVKFDIVEAVYTESYNDFIFDFVVPGDHNFIGGYKGLILHNTTIIQALTGIWTSSHSEELRRGITIKIGYADMPIYKFRKNTEIRYWSYPNYKDWELEDLVRIVSFVDCPGHESLMANMLSGAAVMDGAMLVIAADEPVPRPQTKEHTMALQIMGIKNIVVVQNKLDLVSKEDATENYKMIKYFLSETIYADAPIIPLSAVHRVNLEYLVEALYKYIPPPKRDLNKPYRMFVIRSFDINPPGTPYNKLRGGVIGGSIIDGKIKVGDELEILPGYLTRKDNKIIHIPLYTEVLSLSTRNMRLDEASPGGLIGIQTDLDPSLTKSDGMVGNIAGKPGTLPQVLYDLEMDIRLFKYVIGTDETVLVRPISVKEPVRINIGPAVTLGIVTGKREDIVHVKLSRPVVAENGWKAAIAARYNNKWRLVGVGTIV